MFDPYAHLDLAGRWRPSAHPIYLENPNSLGFFLSPYVNTASPYTSPKYTDRPSISSILGRRFGLDHFWYGRFRSGPYWSKVVVGVIK